MLLQRNIRGIYITRYHSTTHYTATTDINKAIAYTLKVTKH